MIYLSHFFIFFLHFCLLSHFKIIKCIVKSLIATFAEIQLKKVNLKSVFWAPEFECLNHYTGLPKGLDTSLAEHFLLSVINEGECKRDTFTNECNDDHN